MVKRGPEVELIAAGTATEAMEQVLA